MKLAIVVPVAPFESEKALRESIEHVKALSKNFDCKIVYVIDKNSNFDERIRTARSLGVEVIEREGRRGKRAGAINDAVKYLINYSPDFVLILDIDSRTDEKTISNCISALSNSRESYIASAKRCIYNSSSFSNYRIRIQADKFSAKKESFQAV
ncbi:MAG: glycosyltransferase family 2 protein [Archaeoglobaceae archaeon]